MIASERDLELAAHLVLTRCRPDTIYVFGSYGKGVQTDESDVDLLVVGPSLLPRAHRERGVLAVLAGFPKRFDVLWYTEEELAQEARDAGSFVAMILRGARPLYVRRQVALPDRATS